MRSNAALLPSFHPSAFILHPWIPMPTYEYKCFACNHTFERFQSITADPIKRCPECGKAKVKRLLGTGGGFVFKGSGFYITDYRDSTYHDKAKSESGDAAKTGETSSGDAKAPADAKQAADAKPATTAAAEPKP